MKKYNGEIIGLEIEKYVGAIVKGHNCDFEYEEAELKRYRLVFKSGWSLVLWEEYGECSSGWSTASWGNWEWRTVRKPFSYVPQSGPMEAEIKEGEGDNDEEASWEWPYNDDEGKVIEIKTADGTCVAKAVYAGDYYYPSGYVEVNTELFRATKRTMPEDERPVWIFRGASGLGKSSLAADLSGKKVFETDSVQELPSKIWADIIVVGNKKHFSLKAIKRRLPKGAKPILVDFSA